MVQVIPRVSEKNKTRLNVILPWFSLIIVVLVGLGVFFLSARINSSNDRLNGLEEELSMAKSQEETQIEKELIAYKKKVNNMAAILQARKKGSDFYSFLEELVHPDIYFTGISLDMERGVANLTGVTQDFESLGQQISALKESGYILDAQVETVSLGEEEGIGFAMEITIFELEEDK